MSDHLTVILPPVLSAEVRIEKALDYNSLTEGDGYGDGGGYGSGSGMGDGVVDGYGDGFGDGNGRSYGYSNGDGESTADIE
jgi:hypothetical protein